MSKIEMSSDQIFEAIESIANTPGKNDKVSMISACAGSDAFVKTLKAAIDPTVTYGVAKRPALIGANCSSEFDAGTWDLLSDLQHRRLTGNNAIEAIAGEMTALTAKSSELLWRIISKDLKAGFGDSSVNKAIKGLIPVFPYMRCSLPKESSIDEFDWVLGVLSQEKADGMFFNIDIDVAGQVAMSSRQGTQFPLDQLGALVSDLAEFPPNTRLNGEIEVAYKGRVLPREVGNGIMNHIQDGGSFEEGYSPILKLWDMIPLDLAVPKGKWHVGYAERFKTLHFLIKDRLGLRSSPVQCIDTRVVHSLEEAFEHYAELLALGKEGTVVKDPHAIWEDTTSKWQVKLKLEFDVDLKITGFEKGNGKNESTFGSIMTETSDGLLKVNVSGFKDKPGIGYLTRAQIWEARDSLIDTVMTVRANGIMYPSSEGKAYSLFLPRHVEFRRDKIIADDLSRVISQCEAAKSNAIEYVRGLIKEKANKKTAKKLQKAA